MNESEPTVRVEDLSHHFGRGESRKQILFGVDLELEPGRIAILTGPSGSGKTTLLTLVGALRSVQAGSVRVLGRELRGMSRAEMVAVRRQIGFIFQHHNLFDSLTAHQNVRMAAELDASATAADLSRRAADILETLGLGDRLDYKPDSLSGGQRQRVAVARALVNRPRLVLADEPTAALDRDSGREVVKLLQHLAHDHGSTTLLVTHDSRLLDAADRIVNIVDGAIASDVSVAESVEICQFLFEIPLFSRHTPNQLTEIADCMVLERHPAERVLFEEGDVGDRFYLVREGAVDIVVSSDGERQRIATLERGHFFGEQALISDQPRNATAVVRQDAELYSLSEADFKAAIERSKALRDQLLEVLSSRQRS